MRKSYASRSFFAIVALCFIAALFCMLPGGQSERVTYSDSGFILVSETGERANNGRQALKAAGGLQALGIADAQNEFTLLSEIRTASGKIYRFAQCYNSVPVYGRQITVSVDGNGRVNSVSGNYLGMRGVDVNKSNAEMFRQKYPDIFFTTEIYSLGCAPVLCFAFNQNSHRVFVDAVTMETIAQLPLRAEQNAQSQQVMIPQTDYNGNTVTLPAEKMTQSQHYVLGDATRNIYIFDAKGKSDYTADLYKNESGVFGDGAAVSAYNNLIEVYDYYADGNNLGIQGGWPGADGSHDNVHGNAEANGEKSVYALVHYGNRYNNAAYVSGVEGAGGNAVLVFGDGDGTAYESFAAMGKDVSAHEYQHIITESTAGLIYMNASGAINEAVSDVLGALAEGKPMSDDGFWLCGEDLTLQKKALRDMKNPYSLFNPVTVNGRDFKKFCYEQHSHLGCDYGGVHTNSTVISHLAYKMYESMPDYFTPQVTGRLWFDTLLRCVPDVTFEDFRILMEQSARELNFSDAARSCIAAAFDAANIIADENTHTVRFMSHGTYVHEVHSLTGKYGDTFVMPQIHSAPDGYQTQYFYDMKYQAKYYPLQSYKFPAYDVDLYPYNVPKVWNDCTLTEFKGGGRIDDPYLIESAADLASLAYYTNTGHEVYSKYSYYRMTADIDLLNIAWVPIGLSEQFSFSCNLNGNGHKIYNLKVTEKYGSYYCGLFGVMSGRVSNLGVESGVSEFSSYHLGAIAGLCKGDIENCYNKSDILSTNASPTVYTGGIAGMVWNGSINSSYNSGRVSGSVAGGIFGKYICTGRNMSSVGIVPSPRAFGNNYNTGEISGAVAGGIAGSAANAYIVNSINTGRISVRTGLSGENIIGGIAGKLNFADRAIYYDGYDVWENAGITGCKNTGEIDIENAQAAGGIAGLLYDTATSGCTAAEKNVFKKQSGLSAFGSPSDIFGSDKFMGELAKESSDAVFEGDFDFDSRDYYRDMSRWSVLGDKSVFDSVEWNFVSGAMPTHKTPEYWIDFAARSFAGGDGTAQAPYEIATPQQLARLAKLVNSPLGSVRNGYFRASYILTENIDLEGKIWTGIGAEEQRKEDFGYVVGFYNGFAGTFDANGYEIRNMSARDTRTEEEIRPNGASSWQVTYAALFSVLYSNYNSVCTVRGVKLTNVNNVSSNWAAGIVAYSSSVNTVIEDCTVDGAIASGGVAGGIFGEYNAGFDKTLKIENCKNRAYVSGETAGGILGRAGIYAATSTGSCEPHIKSCVNGGGVTVYCDKGFWIQRIEHFGGGIAGHLSADTVVESCINTGGLRSYDPTSSVGGFVGGVSALNERGSRVTLDLSDCKQAGKYETEASVVKYGAAVGILETRAESYTAELNIANCIVKDGTLFSYDVNTSGGGEIVFNGSGNRINATSEMLEFDNIEYFFNEEYWTQIDPETANDMYEFFGNEPKLFSVTYLDELGAFLHSESVRYKCLPVGTVPPPKPSDEKYDYVFDGWEGLKEVTSDLQVTAKYKADLRSFTVVFKNYDGTVVYTQSVKYGEMPTPPLTEITKPSDEKYDYVFDGWEGLKEVTSDLQVTAKYKADLRSFTVVFKNYDGTVVYTQSVKYGEMPTPPLTEITKPSDEKYDYVFDGWGEMRPVTADVEYTATFTAEKKSSSKSDNYALLVLVIICEMLFTNVGIVAGVVVLGGLAVWAVCAVVAGVVLLILWLIKRKRKK